MSAIALQPGTLIAETSERPAINPWFVALTVTLATFMELLDTSIANVALPNIAGGLASGVDEATWVLTSYLVANAVVLPLSAWLSEVIGRKRYYLICVALFTGSSLLCGLAPSLPMLIFFRVLQGIGGGGLAPVSQAILVDTFSVEKRASAFAVYGLAAVLGPAFGPTIGGLITDSISWRWVFFINIPVGLIALFLSSQLVHDPPVMLERTALARRARARRFRRHHAHRARLRLPGGRARQGPAQRLVRLIDDLQLFCRRDHRAHRRRLVGAPPARSGGRSFTPDRA
jgi:DHA2 family multidrug resistance protein